MTKKKPHPMNIVPVSDEVFQHVYDAPSSLPGRYKYPSKTSLNGVYKIVEDNGETVGSV